nr:hypothetical protein [Tanacetum cinerariifolium]
VSVIPGCLTSASAGIFSRDLSPLHRLSRLSIESENTYTNPANKITPEAGVVVSVTIYTFPVLTSRMKKSLLERWRSRDSVEDVNGCILLCMILLMTIAWKNTQKHKHKHLESAIGNHRWKRGRCQVFRQLCRGGRDEPQTEKLMM